MDKVQALYSFWSGFGIPAIDEQSAYDTDTLRQLGIDFPYITFESAVGDFQNAIMLGADLYYRSTSWAEIEAKAEEIMNGIGYAGKIVDFDGGRIWITKTSPNYRRMPADNPFDIRRIHIDVNVLFMTS